jgi:phosphopantothenate---cysteine ligase (CTP)
MRASPCLAYALRQIRVTTVPTLMRRRIESSLARRGGDVADIDNAMPFELSSAPMRCLVTAGPTYEPLDQVRRLTNFSTGRLGSELANYLTSHGHGVDLLLGYYAVYRGPQQAQNVETFTTTADLHQRLASRASETIDAVFHAAAVSDFAFGQVWKRDRCKKPDDNPAMRHPDGRLLEPNSDLGQTGLRTGKLTTREGVLLAELVPTPKIIRKLRAWYPRAFLAGWKHEVDGDRRTVLVKARQQMADNRTDACVANGPAYGEGFGLVSVNHPETHLADAAVLFEALEDLIRRR